MTYWEYCGEIVKKIKSGIPNVELGLVFVVVSVVSSSRPITVELPFSLGHRIIFHHFFPFLKESLAMVRRGLRKSLEKRGGNARKRGAAVAMAVALCLVEYRSNMARSTN